MTAIPLTALDRALHDLDIALWFLGLERSPDHPLIRSQQENLRLAREELVALRKKAEGEVK